MADVMLRWHACACQPCKKLGATEGPGDAHENIARLIFANEPGVYQREGFQLKESGQRAPKHGRHVALES